MRKLEIVNVQQEIKSDVIRILEEALAEAKAGNIDEVAVLTYHAADESGEPWGYHLSPTRRLMGWIGHLETTKIEWAIDRLKTEY